MGCDDVLMFQGRRNHCLLFEPLPRLGLRHFLYDNEAFQRCVHRSIDLRHSTSTKNINNLIEYFTEKNILPTIIEPEPILIAKTLNMEKNLKKNKVYLAVHYEPTNKVVIVGVWRGYPYFFREINIMPGEEEYKTAELHYPTLKDVWSLVEHDISGAVEYLKKETEQEIEKIFIYSLLSASLNRYWHISIHFELSNFGDLLFRLIVSILAHSEEHFFLFPCLIKSFPHTAHCASIA